MCRSSISLPNEILEECFRRLGSQDLLNVIFVCRIFADVGRHLLYRTISLRSDQRHVQHTISLLARDHTVAVKISNAILTTVPPFEDVPWILPDFFKESVNLRFLELRGFPFSRREDQGVFNSVLRTRCTKLSSFVYRPGVLLFPGSGFELTGLKCVTWQSSLETIDLKLTPIMVASAHSLTSISFEGMIVHRVDKPYDAFLKYEFPNLTTLQLGSLIQTNTQERTKEAITKFILNHKKIAHLSLGRRRINDMFFQFREEMLTPDSLSGLKSFEGFPENIFMMVRRQVASLSNLTALSLFCCPVDGFRELSEMFEAIRSSAGPKKLNEVTHIGMYADVRLNHRLPSNMTPLIVRRLMDQFAELCPSVTGWHGRLYPMPADTFRKMFEPFEHLETISLPSLAFVFIQPNPLTYFAPIAGKCRKLQRVIAHRPPYTELECTIYSLLRHAYGGLEAVDVSTTYDISTTEIGQLYNPSYTFYH